MDKTTTSPKLWGKCPNQQTAQHNKIIQICPQTGLDFKQMPYSKAKYCVKDWVCERILLTGRSRPFCLSLLVCQSESMVRCISKRMVFISGVSFVDCCWLEGVLAKSVSHSSHSLEAYHVSLSNGTLGGERAPIPKESPGSSMLTKGDTDLLHAIKCSKQSHHLLPAFLKKQENNEELAKNKNK